ncbi:putative neurochondrin [Rosa chinensis]|uniref:Putative neurochondrin n=1 Tax=Rosa chinensis TaxID=74649 RepID=A0A2P6PXM2_ROSCH|nr:putative neurochondrin [Rosa chinensis]
MDQSSPALDDCLKLLKGERDEQRLAGLLLVTKFCKGDDLSSLLTIYDAVGVQFLDRLLRTGMGKGSISENQEAYLQLSVTVLAAFCRVPEIAASNDMVSKIPLVLEVLSKESGPAVLEECYEFLYLVSTASEDGIMTFYSSGGMKMLASHMPNLPDGSHQMKITMKLVQLLLTKFYPDRINNDYLPELSIIVAAIARQFSILHDAMKFDALHILTAIFSPKFSAPLYDSLRALPEKIGPIICVMVLLPFYKTVLVSPTEKLQALILAESMVTIFGEKWLVGQINSADGKGPFPTDRCLVLVLEQSRVEVAVLLNELAYLKDEASKKSSPAAETIFLKKRNVAIAFSILEKIINLISNASENEGDLIHENTLSMVINGLNETIGVVLEYLQDAKEHEQRKGDDLLASVRVIGSYLAEAPLACREKVRELLEYMLSIEGEDEPRPFYAICFLLPMLCQLTMEVKGCKALISCGGHKSVVDCLVNLIGPHGYKVEDRGCIFLACDTILNLLLKKEQVQAPLDYSTLVNLLKALAHWTEGVDDPSIIMMASSICTLLFDFTSEKALLKHPDFDESCLNNLSRLIARSMAAWGQDMSDAAKAETDLLEIVTAGYSRWVTRFPCVRDAVER